MNAAVAKSKVAHWAENPVWKLFIQILTTGLAAAALGFFGWMQDITKGQNALERRIALAEERLEIRKRASEDLAITVASLTTQALSMQINQASDRERLTALNDQLERLATRQDFFDRRLNSFAERTRGIDTDSLRRNPR